MTVDEHLVPLGPELAADYLAIAQTRGGPRAVERTALRTRSRSARDLLAYAASPGRLSAAELVSRVRAARDSRSAPPAPPLDLEWSLSLVRVIGMQNLDDSDLDDAVLLLQELRLQHGPAMLNPIAEQTVVERLWQAGEYRLLRSWLPQLRHLRSDTRRYLNADLTNPFVEPAGAGVRRSARARWQRLINEIFAEHEIEPFTVESDATTPFDGLRCAVDDVVTGGPLVTVIMPVFRPGQELITSVRSICDQTWRNLEILIMDDASPPCHDEVLSACAALDNRVQVHRMDQNGGTYLARNAALDIATGELVTVQDVDDWSHPRRIELQARALLADPSTPATRSFCLRVSEDLVFQRPGYGASQENASSLMFRREQALATVGYFDRSRKSADTEFRRRLELAAGALTTDLRAPLAMVRMAGGSLSRSDFTPGWHHVSRYVYRAAYERWHAQRAFGEDHYLPRFQQRRRFAVPQRFQIDQTVLADRPPHYDVVLLSDWRQFEVAQHALIEQLGALTASGYRVGVANLESYLHMSARRQPLDPRILDLVNAGTVDFVALDQISSVSLLVVRPPELLEFAPAARSTLDVEQVLVVADQPPRTVEDDQHRYSVARCDSTVRTMFSREPVWLPDGPDVRALIEGEVLRDRLSSRIGGALDADLSQVTELLGAPREPDPPDPADEPMGTTAAARTARLRPRRPHDPGWGPRLDLRVVLTVSANVAPRLSETLQRVREHEQLLGTPITVVYDPAARAEAQDAALRYPAVAFVPADGSSSAELAAAAQEQLEIADVRFVSVADLPRVRDIRSWSRALHRHLGRLEQAHLEVSRPLLVWTRHCSHHTVAAYLARSLAPSRGESGPFNDYLASLCLRAANPRVEALDPSSGAIEVFVWLNAKVSPAVSRPPWQYRVALIDGKDNIAISSGSTLEQRIDSDGHPVWENLSARVPLQQAGNGNHVFTIEVDTDVEAFRTRRRLRPSKGLLLDARPVAMPTSAASEQTMRYLVHAAGSNATTFLTTQQGRGLKGRLQWAATLVRKDLGTLRRGRSGRRMGTLRLVRLVTRPFFLGRRIWLIGERTDTAQDNGLHLFRYVRQTEPWRPVYYVIDRASPQRERVRGLGHVVDHSSLRHQLLMLHADVLANAYSIRYLRPSSWTQEGYVQHLAWRIGALRVYLKHGVHLNPNAVKRGLSGYDLFLTVMPRETEAIRAVSGYDRQIREIGMPRYDGLVPTSRSRTILFMPTWRQYLVPRLSGRPNPGQVPFQGSLYEQFISGFLGSPRLHALLDKHDYRLSFLPHYNMASSFDISVWTADRISVADTNVTSFQDLLRTCDVFITDYSSVHFDVAYLGTPVIYARFDEADYESGHASRSWFDYERDGYGPVVRGVHQTLDALEGIVERDCTMEEIYSSRVASSFTFRDRDNCARTVAAIDALDSDRQKVPKG